MQLLLLYILPHLANKVGAEIFLRIFGRVVPLATNMPHITSAARYSSFSYSNQTKVCLV